MTAAVSFPAVEHDWLKGELDSRYSRGLVTVASGAGNLPSGAVLSKITASSKYALYDPTETDGTEDPDGCVILMRPADASAADVADALVIEWGAEVARQVLHWGAGVTTEGHKNAAAASLAVRRVMLRRAV